MCMTRVSPEGQKHCITLELELEAVVCLWVLELKLESSVGVAWFGIFVHCVKMYLL